MRKLLYITLLLVSFYSTRASHIVGGELYYDCLGGDQYRLTLKLYRDCYCTNCAEFGATEYLSIFNEFGSLYAQPGMPFPGAVNLNPPITNPCMVQPDVCVERAIYTCTVTLPPTNGGYDIVYQRCCRNNGVTNVPQDQGATYQVHIPGSPFATCNNSPRFNNFPPMYLCVNAPIVFDHSATDPDGDQLVYSLCDPYSGADPTCPDPSPNSQGGGCASAPFSPPYSSVSYNSPYSPANFMNNPSGINNLKIDPQTGLLTGTPNTIGLFVVAVCVSEYRNGVLLGEMRRDFQFNVTQCNIPIANIPSFGINPANGIGIYSINCKSFTVDFVNNSYNPPPVNNPQWYHWDFGVPGVTNDTSNLQNPQFTFPDTGAFLVTLIAYKSAGNGGVCEDTTSAYIYVYPTFNTDFTTADICADIPAQFTDGTVSTGGPITQWRWNFGDGGTSTQISPGHQYANPGSYNVTLISQNDKGCKDTAQKTINVLPAPVASYTTSATCIGQPTTFNNTSTGNVISYSWSFGDGNTAIQQSPVHTYAAVGSYQVRLIIATAEGCADTLQQLINVNPLPVINIPNDTTICPFTSVQLYSGGGVSYQWSPPTGLNNPTGANPVATPTPPNAITYTVVVTDANQCINTDSVRISFHAIPQVNAGPDTSVCLNPGNFQPSVQLNATGAATYVWTPTTGLNNPNIANPVSTPTANTKYVVTGTDVNGCSITDSVNVFVLDPALNVVVQPSVTICEGDTTGIAVVSQGQSTTYSWSPNQYISNASELSPYFYPRDTTLYIITISNYCYTKSDSVLIIVWPLPQLALNPLDSICITESIQLQAYDAQTYLWDANPTLSATNIPDPVATPTVTTTYYVTGTSALGCVARDTTQILVYFPSVLTITPQVPYVCLGTPVQLNVTGAYTYQWRPDPTLSATNIANPIANPTDTTMYFVDAVNIHGCASSDSVTLNVQFPVTAVTLPLFDGCQGQPVQLQASGGFYYEWTPPTGLNNPFVNDPFAMPDTTTAYVITVSNDCFSDSAVTLVIVHPLPVVDAGPDTTIWRDTNAQLRGFTNETNHFWNPSTWLDDPYNLNTNAQPQQTMYYELFAIDQYGCLSIDSVLITVIPYTVLDIPTAFSPDGNGVNDVFRIVRYLNIDNLIELAVYNRWGNKVFSTTNIEQGWDGRYNEEPQPLGVYVWMVSADAKDGERIVKKGNVTLVR
ncbi:MAG TPA: PKD domain-containing protein [Chitinophagales bacterium]|nr:PKD domain-containing protein [Chitinophagales bacterium]